jgi:hypothetical protein
MECECGKENVGLVYNFIYQSLDMLHYIIVDSGTMFDCSTRLCNNLLFKSTISQMSFMNAYRQFEVIEFFNFFKESCFMFLVFNFKYLFN